MHSRAGKAISIEVMARGLHKETTLAHEVGHFLDHQGIDGVGYASKIALEGKTTSSLDGWWLAVARSQAYKTLLDKQQSPDKYVVTVSQTSVIEGVTREYTSVPDRAFLSYLLGPEELWARSYAQYIAVKSGDATMLTQIARDRESKLYAESQWEAGDFVPIEQAIDALFAALGWRG